MDARTIREQWNAGNNAGEGFNPVGIMLDAPIAYADQGTDHEIAVYHTDRGIIGIGDANGPWAVELREE